MANPERRTERGRTPAGQGSSRGLRAAGRSRRLLRMMGRLRPWLRGNTRWGRVRAGRRSRRGIQRSGESRPKKAGSREHRDTVLMSEPFEAQGKLKVRPPEGRSETAANAAG